MADFKNKKSTNQKKGLFNKRTLAMCVMAATAATQSYAQDDETPATEEVIVYGIKQSLETAQDIKREASTVKDVITASDIGSLPDKSIVEALQRVPGVAIERFEASDDPDHFTVEGGSVVIRGLNRVRSEFNGRDAFSADSSGGLNFDDIAPEMVGSVEVSKNQTADMVEGGVSGTINLITRKPFDSDDLVLGFTAKANYAERPDEASPSLSGLASNVWDLSDGGKFGALLAFSSSTIHSRGDGIGVYNYYPATVGAQQVIGPVAVSARQQENERDRLGLSGSLQWQNAAESVTVTLEAIHSNSTLAWTEHFIENPSQPFAGETTALSTSNRLGTNILSSDDVSFDRGVFTGGTLINSTPAATWTDQIPDSAYVTGSRNRADERSITDISLNIDFQVNDNFSLEVDIQNVTAETDIIDNTAHGRFISDAKVSLDDSNPSIDFFDANKDGNDAVDPLNADSYFWRSAMDHISQNEGEMTAFALNGEYTFDEGFITSVKGGFRTSSREQTIRESTYNWGNVSEVWAAGQVRFSDPALGDAVEQFAFDNHMDGGSFASNNTFWFPSTSLLADGAKLSEFMRNNDAFYTKNADGSRNAFIPAWTNIANRSGVEVGTPFLPSENYLSTEDRNAAFVRVDFGDIDSDVRMSGNVGLRWVTYQIESEGADNYPSAISNELIGVGRPTTVPALAPAIPADVVSFHTGDGGPRYTVKGDEFNRVLPSLNLKFGISDDLIVRFAASQSMFMPNLRDIRNSRVINSNSSAVGEAIPVLDAAGAPVLDGDGNPTTVPAGAVHNGFTANSAGNPKLKPEFSTNIDLAFEWYFNDLGSFTSTLFYKKIKDFHRNTTFNAAVPNFNDNNNTQTVAVTTTQNAGTAILSGFELAYQTTFGFLGEQGENFGVQSSYTFIDGSPDDDGVNIRTDNIDGEFTFRNFSNLPLEGLSQDNYNIVLFYDDSTFEARFAYSWRSNYLLNSRDVISFSPIYSDATGQLDFSASWRINDMFKVGVQANNLLDEITHTRVQYNQEGQTTPRSYFSNGRAFSAFVTATF